MLEIARKKKGWDAMYKDKNELAMNRGNIETINTHRVNR